MIRISYHYITTSAPNYLIKCYAALLVLSFFSVNPLRAQDVIHLKTGGIIIGELTIEYSTNGRDDQVTLKREGKVEKIDAESIDFIETAKGKKLILVEVQYYYDLLDKVNTRRVLISQLLNGFIELYEYKGRDFSFVIKRGDKVRVLQKLKAENGLFSNYRVVLLEELGSTIERDEIFQTKYKKSRFIYLVNQKNVKLDPNYLPLIDSKPQKSENEFQYSFGTNITDLNISIPISRLICIDRVCTVVQTPDKITSKGPSIGYVLGFAYQKSFLKRLKGFKYKVGFVLQSQRFELMNSDPYHQTGNISSSELLLYGGISKSFFEEKEISLSTSISPVIWFSGFHKDVYINYGLTKEEILNYNIAKGGGFGINLSTGLNYRLNDKYVLGIIGSYFLRDGSEYYTFNNFGNNTRFVNDSRANSKLINYFSLTVELKVKKIQMVNSLN